MSEAVEEAEQQIDEALRHVKRVYVAVHGIGEQLQFETVQHVANRLGKYFGRRCRSRSAASTASG